MKVTIPRLRKRVSAALKAAELDLLNNNGGADMYTRGLSGEGYAGGYLQALRDVLMVIDGIAVSHNINYNNFWKEENNE